MQKHFSLASILAMEKQKRVHLINSLGGFKCVALVGTQNGEGKTNLAIFSSFFHIGANPPLIGMIFRPSPPERDTMRNILDTGFYTINHINEGIFKQAHQTSARYDQSVSEFDATGLQPEYIDSFSVPFVKESTIKLAMEFKEKIEVKSNNTVIVIGAIKEVYLPDEMVHEDGFIDLEKANTLTCSGLDSYHKTIQIDRLSYAKPNEEIVSLLKK